MQGREGEDWGRGEWRAGEPRVGSESSQPLTPALPLALKGAEETTNRNGCTQGTRFNTVMLFRDFGWNSRS